ncbi:U11/U12 SMALL NUCLEAR RIBONUCLEOPROTEIN 25 KDA PROTEIN [Salix koriyanagi]|uniref:U11/U12 SMALL NUCLEAR RIBONUCLEOPROTEIN 25 kDa PROTEIN n=1 Tax=Salix koriyanagi TaxID=2511006 RepID=A0A9Q0VBC9_9ROSI|nr:U11/U12 SMALL NUCLEAR RIBONUCLEOPROTEIN 25 KDA PROTEIN [Salix koriyanagi]
MTLDGRRSSFSNITKTLFYSYNKLPEEPLRLSVLKLDASSFEIEVMKKGRERSHGRMCGGIFACVMVIRKLLMETDYIKNYGIRDGDQLQFIRHVSGNYSLKKKHSLKKIAGSESPKMCSSLSPSNRSEEEKEQDYKEDEGSDDLENGSCQHFHDKNDGIVIQDEARWNCFFRQWYMYSRLSTTDRKIGWKTSPSRSACGFLGSIRRILQLYGNNSYSRKGTLRED